VARARWIATRILGAIYRRRPVHLAAQVARRLSGCQLNPEQLGAVATAARGGTLLVFGVGYDAAWWSTVADATFLENDADWAGRVRRMDARLTVIDVTYETQRHDWQAQLEGTLAVSELRLPAEVAGRRWDVVLVDAPAGYDDETPGRVQSIGAASSLSSGGPVFVDGCDRELEAAVSVATFADRPVLRIGKLWRFG